MNSLLEIPLFRRNHICPWWLCFTFDNLFRRAFHNPYKIFGRYVREGYTVLDVGAGMGYFTIPLARMVGENGKVLAVDVQEKMLRALKRRAQRAGLAKRVEVLLTTEETIGIKEEVDLALAFWMVHEVPDRARFLQEIKSVLKDQGLFLMVEPVLHVSSGVFRETVDIALGAGFALRERPHVFMSHSALFALPEKTGTP